MGRRLVLVFGSALVLSGCGLSVPNGVFSCLASRDCPSGYVCWSSDGRCYDTEEPKLSCVPDTCEQVISQFAELGVEVECGSLPDGCDGVVQCPPCPNGQVCGANGRSFACGCEPNTCSSQDAECGSIAAGCGATELVNCGSCPGKLECESNRCVCPEGEDCADLCGGCADAEICVDGQCCTPLFPCSEHQCSPPTGLPDGCGGYAVCPPCGTERSCELEPATQTYACVGDCTCV